MAAVRKLADGVSVGEWTITAKKGPILSSVDFDDYADRLGIPVPEMTFGASELTMKHSNGFSLSFRAYDALDTVNKHENTLVVQHPWSEKRAPNGDKIEMYKPFDWTYTCDYHGTMTGRNGEPAPHAEVTEEEIDMARLRREDPILFYGDVLLFEDELADNGLSILSVKVRVMPEFFFVLQRQFIRVDGVLARIHDTRYFHDFSTSHLLRDHGRLESTMHDLSERKGSHFAESTDPAVLGPALECRSHSLEKIIFK